MTKEFRIPRRAFLAAAIAPLLPRTHADEPSPHLETLTEWLQATPDLRKHALQSCLDRIREQDDSIRAWVQVSPRPSTGRGPLAHIPYGAKDIVETRGMATEYGSPIYRGRVGTNDAPIIREMSKHGAILVGKTETTAFAYRTPPPTRNPRNLEHTPGGSSSGSAAAVAAGMVPLAIGEQTLGSVVRPASFCGVTGFKPSYGLLPMQGVLPLAKSLDTLGFFTHTAQDMVALWEALGHPIGRPEALELGTADPLPPTVEPSMAEAFQTTLARLRRDGVSIRPLPIAGLLGELAEAATKVMTFEGARFHEQRYREFGDRLDDLATLVRNGLQISQHEYERTVHVIADAKARFATQFAMTPVILTPAAVGPAPRGLSSTGDATMNSPWTALGVPAVTIPMPVPGLPLGLQLTAAYGQDARVLRTAASLERRLSAIG